MMPHKKISLAIKSSSQDLVIQLPTSMVGRNLRVEVKTTDDNLNGIKHSQSLGLPGNPISKEEFIDYLEAASLEPTFSLNEIKSSWQKRKEILLKQGE
jgi:hypothetical protein